MSSKLKTVRKGYPGIYNIEGPLTINSGLNNNSAFSIPSNNSNSIFSNNPVFDFNSPSQRAMAIGNTRAQLNNFGILNGTGLALGTNKSGKGVGWGAIAGAAATALGSIKTGDKRGMWDTLDPVYHQAGGRESAAGNAMSDAGVTLTLTGLSSGLPWLALAGAGLKVLGGLTNAAWGIKENKENVNFVNNSIANKTSAGNLMSRASTSDELVKSAGSMTSGSGFSAGDLYKGGWFSGGAAQDKGNELLDKEKSALAFLNHSLVTGARNVDLISYDNIMRNFAAWGGPIDSIDVSTPIGYSFMNLYLNNRRQDKTSGNMFAGTSDNIFASGGGMGTNGTVFDNNISHINAGGSHESNPEEGVKVGVDLEGTPNLVEEGEVIYDDYVFSNRLNVPDFNRKDKSLEAKMFRKYSGKTFAYTAGKIEKKVGADERIDSITLRGLDAELQLLAQLLEKEREKERLLELLDAIDQMSPEEFSMFQQLMLADLELANQLAMLQQMMQQQQMQLPLMQLSMQQPLLMIPQGMELMVSPELMMAAYGGPIYALGGLMDNWGESNKFGEGGTEEKFREWWKKYIDKKALVNGDSEDWEYRPINYQKIYSDITGKNFIEDPNNDDGISRLVYNALEKLYIENPSKFGEYDHWAGLLNDLQNATQTKTEEDFNPLEGKKPPYTMLKRGDAIEGPEGLIFNYYNETHPDAPISAEKWNEKSDKEKKRYIKRKFKGNKKAILDYNNRLSEYNEQKELQRKMSEWEKQRDASPVNEDDLKNFNYDDLERIALEVNPKYVSEDISTFSTEKAKEAEDNLRKNIAEWAKDNKNGTVGHLNQVFRTPDFHTQWNRTPLDSSDRWIQKGYDFDTFNLLLSEYEGSMNPGNLGDTYAGDENIDLDGASSIAELQEQEGYKNYTNAIKNLIKKIGDNSWEWGDNGAIFKEDNNLDLTPLELALLNTLKATSHRTAIGEKNLFTANDDGSISFAKDASGFINRVRNDNIGGVWHFTPKMLEKSDVYRINNNEDNEDYYSLDEIEAKTPNWKNYYIEDPETTTMEDGTIVHTLRYRNPLLITRAIPEGIVKNEDGTYSYTDAGKEEELERRKKNNIDFPEAPTWPLWASLGMQGLGLAYNVLRSPDYTYANALKNAATLAGNYSTVEFRPEGTYLTYKPEDIWYNQNMLNANAMATDRMLANNAAPISTQLASRITNAYNNQLSNGNVHRQALEYDNNLAKEDATFNRGTGLFNSEGFLKADMANQDAASRAKSYQLEGLKSAYAMYRDIDNAREKAINAGISGIASGLYNIGLTNWNNALYKYAIDKGAYMTAHGGKLRRKKGLTF